MKYIYIYIYILTELNHLDIDFKKSTDFFLQFQHFIVIDIDYDIYIYIYICKYNMIYHLHSCFSTYFENKIKLSASRSCVLNRNVLKTCCNIQVSWLIYVYVKIMICIKGTTQITPLSEQILNLLYYNLLQT